MRIERIETIALEMPLPRIYRGSFYDLTHRATLITRVYTDQGIVGEIYNGDDAEVQKDVARVIDRFIAPALVGADVFNIEGCWEKALPVSFNIRLPRKVATTAIAAVDSALWDALGKALGQPLYKLWGGYRDRLPVICIAGYYEDGKTLADYGREMEDLRRRGFAGCKFKVGGRSPRRTPRGCALHGRAGGRISCSPSTPTKPTASPMRSPSAASSRTWTSAGSRSRAAGATIASPWRTSARLAASRWQLARASITWPPAGIS